MAYRPVDHPPRSCLWCSCLFKPRTSHQRFCAKSCYKRHGKAHRGHSTGKRESKALRARPYIKYKGSKCEHCGFVPVHSCQLDVDHIDGDRSNNHPENLQTLCANCHRLKTLVCRDGPYKRMALA